MPDRDDARSPEVSVVIPTRNRLALLKESTASVAAQTFRDMETVVVDDASEDDTPRWLAANERPDFRTVRLDARSERSAARNRGLDEARGHFVIFLDDDDLLVPTAIERLVGGLHRHERSVAAIGAHVFFDETGNRIRRPHPRRVVERDAWRDVLFYWESIPSRTLFRANVVRAVGGFPEGIALAEDWDLLVRVSRQGPLLLIPDTVVEYRRHQGQTPVTFGEATVDELATKHASTLPASDRQIVERVRRARYECRLGDRALTDLESGAAMRHFVSAIRIHPGLLSSPITRPVVTRRLAKSIVALVVGGSATRALRRVKAFGRRVAGRDVQSTDDRGTGSSDR